MFEVENETAFDQNVPVLFPARRLRRRRVDRNLVAALLAVGFSVTEVAEKAGCSRQHVWRMMRRSESLGRALATVEFDVAREANGKLAALRPVVASALLRALADRNVRVMLWLADRLGLGIDGYAAPRHAAVAKAEALHPKERRELKRLRKQVALYRGELARRDIARHTGGPIGDDADVA